MNSYNSHFSPFCFQPKVVNVTRIYKTRRQVLTALTFLLFHSEQYNQAETRRVAEINPCQDNMLTCFIYHLLCCNSQC